MDPGAAVGLASVAAGGETVADGAVEVDHAWIDAGQWRVDVAGREVPARVSLRPFYDPTSARAARDRDQCGHSRQVIAYP